MPLRIGVDLAVPAASEKKCMERRRKSKGKRKREREKERGKVVACMAREMGIRGQG